MNEEIKLDRSIFVNVPKAVILATDLSPNAKLLWFALASMDISGDRGAWPSLTLLGEIIGASKPTVLRAVKELEDYGVLVRERRHNEGGQTTNLYRVDLPESVVVSKDSLPTPVKKFDGGSQKSLYGKTIKSKDHKLLKKEEPGVFLEGFLSTYQENFDPDFTLPADSVQRKYAQSLVSELGLEKALKLAEAAALIQGKEFAPSIVSPKDLYHKRNNLTIWYRQNRPKEVVAV